MPNKALVFREENRLPGLFDIIKCVNSAYKGSYEFLSKEEFGNYHTALRLAIECWEPGNHLEKILYLLLVEACNECEALSLRFDYYNRV